MTVTLKLFVKSTCGIKVLLQAANSPEYIPNVVITTPDVGDDKNVFVSRELAVDIMRKTFAGKIVGVYIADNVSCRQLKCHVARVAPVKVLGLRCSIVDQPAGFDKIIQFCLHPFLQAIG